MYHKILIANRADCALRLIHACHDMGIQAVCIAARDDDLHAVHETADEIIYTGMSRDAYTNEDDILEAARQSGCEAILPGWGFLSEDFAFARRCRLMGMHFIGPSARQLQCFGDKLKTLELLDNHVTEISHRAIRCDCIDLEKCRLENIQVPYMLKGRYGGGGKQIARFQNISDLNKRLEQLRKTCSLAQFYVEPAIENASHVEFQCFGDGNGHVEMLGLRDCTPQVHHQKWLEISINAEKYPELDGICNHLKEKLGEMHYSGWGTVEYLIEKDGHVHLLELNPRLQVEHGVTEMSRGIDLVQKAIQFSCSGKMPEWNFHPYRETIEFRLYARGTGTIEKIGFDGCKWPEFFCPKDCECRIESAYRLGDVLNGVYDGMIARFILATDSSMAYGRIKEWLKTFHLDGIEHNLKDLYHLDLGDSLGQIFKKRKCGALAGLPHLKQE